MTKRILSFLLVVSMVLTILPVEASEADSVVYTKEDLVAALEPDGTGDVILGADITDITTQLTVERSTAINLNGYKLTVTLDEETGQKANGIKLASGVTLTIRDSSSTSNGELTVTNNVSMVMNNDVSDGNMAAINTSDGKLIVESGNVYAYGGYCGAGIGGGFDAYKRYTAGEIIILGGNVTAIGGHSAAGIGTGKFSSGGTVKISGGVVYASNGDSAAAIGSGYGGSNVTVEISGGKVTAIAGGSHGTGIGGGYQGNGGMVKISGGEVTATGTNYAAGIGCGYQGNGGTVEISGGIVTATGGIYAAGIGGGRECDGGTVEISGGTVIATNAPSSGGLYYAPGIGGGYQSSSNGTLKITGGSVNPRGISVVPVDTNGNELKKATLTLKGSIPLADTMLADSGHTIEVGGTPYPYGTKDLKTDAEGKVYFWLPANTYDITLMSEAGDVYTKDYVVITNADGEATLMGPTYETYLRRAADKGGEYKLPVDFDGSPSNDPSLTSELSINKDFILDLNGHNLTINIYGSKGINIAPGVTFTIKDSSTPSAGKLIVNNKYGGPGISTTDAKLIIEGGTVTAVGYWSSAGIGGYDGEDNGIVEIRGGTVNATGGDFAAGIGGGSYGRGGTVKISGGIVNATGGRGCPGIGAGYAVAGSYVEITGGTVIATGTVYESYSYVDIGSPYYATKNDTLKISGGSVNAKKIINNEYVSPKAADGTTTVYLVILTVTGDSGPLADTVLEDTSYIVKDSADIYIYGTKDLKTDAEGKVHLWLPEGTYSITLKADGTCYANSNVEVKAGSDNSAELTVAPIDITDPIITAGDVNRTSDTEATVKFTSSESGQYYYEAVDDNAGDPNIDTSGPGLYCGTTEVTFQAVLTPGAKDLWIYVKDAAGNVGKLKIDIPACPLDTPTGAAWDETIPGKAVWIAVPNASSYTLQLYKDGAPVGSLVTDVTAAEYDFTGAITSGGMGSYTFKVKAIGDGTIRLDSAESNESPAYNYVPPLTGTAVIDNTAPRIGDELTGSLDGGNNTGELSYVWKADGQEVSSGEKYTVTIDEYGKAITLEITSSIEPGTIKSAPTEKVKKKVGPAAPLTPEVLSKTHNSVTLKANAAYEFSMDGSTWQSSNVFSGLDANTEYTFYQ